MEPETGPVDRGDAEVGEDEGAPAGPSLDEEMALQAEENGDVVAVPVTLPTVPEEADPAPRGELPAMDELIKRIPAEVQDTLDELFRAKFVKVERVAKKHLKR